MKIVYLIVFICSGASLFAQEINPREYFTEEQWTRANTASEVKYLTQEERDIFLYNNLARMYPKAFVKFYHAYTSSSIWPWGGPTSTSYYESLTTDLNEMEPVGALKPDFAMYELAACWAEESGRLGLVGHDRVDCPGGYSGENCAYGNERGVEFVIQLLVDNGVPSLGHRINMLRPAYKGLGVAIRPHKNYRMCAVQNFTRTNDSLRTVRAKKDSVRALVEAERIRKEEAKQAAAEAARLAREAEGEAVEAQWTDERQQLMTIQSLDYLTDFEKELYTVINLIRLNPQKFLKTYWSTGPYYNQSLDLVQANVHSSSGYKKLKKWLQTAQPMPLLVPSISDIEAVRCVQKLDSPDERSFACMRDGGFRSMDSFFFSGTDVYRVAIEELLNDKFSLDLVTGRGIAGIDMHQNGYLNRVFLKRR